MMTCECVLNYKLAEFYTNILFLFPLKPNYIYNFNGFLLENAMYINIVCTKLYIEFCVTPSYSPGAMKTIIHVCLHVCMLTSRVCACTCVHLQKTKVWSMTYCCHRSIFPFLLTSYTNLRAHIHHMEFSS